MKSFQVILTTVFILVAVAGVAGTDHRGVAAAGVDRGSGRQIDGRGSPRRPHRFHARHLVGVGAEKRQRQLPAVAVDFGTEHRVVHAIDSGRQIFLGLQLGAALLLEQLVLYLEQIIFSLEHFSLPAIQSA